MLGAQLIAAHSAAMECYRRAMIADQTFEGRKKSLTQANKLSRTYVTLLDALNRHRGKPPLWGQDPQQVPVPRPGDAERALPHARRSLTRRPKG